jgi:hypothetical protein
MGSGIDMFEFLDWEQTGRKAGRAGGLGRALWVFAGKLSI